MLILDNIDQNKQEIIKKDFENLVNSLNINVIFFKTFDKDKLINLQNNKNNIIIYFQEYTKTEKKIIKRVIIYNNTNIYVSKYTNINTKNYITIRSLIDFNTDCIKHKRIYCGEYIIIYDNILNEINYYYNIHCNFCGDCYINNKYNKHLTLLNTLFNEQYKNYKKTSNYKNKLLIDILEPIKNESLEPIKNESLEPIKNNTLVDIKEAYNYFDIFDNTSNNENNANTQILYDDITIKILTGNKEFIMILKNLNVLMLCNKLYELYGKGIIIYDNDNNTYIYDISNN